VDLDLGSDPSNAEALVSNPEHLGLDETVHGITLVEIILGNFLAIGIPKAGNVPSVGESLVGIGLEKKKLETESIGILFLVGNLDARIVIGSDDFTGEFLLEKGLGVLDCVVNDKVVHVLNHLPEIGITLVVFNSLKGNIKGLLERIGLVGTQTKWGPHFGSLDKGFVITIANGKLDVVSTIRVGLVFAKIYALN